jgi:hypothetical protein
VTGRALVLLSVMPLLMVACADPPEPPEAPEPLNINCQLWRGPVWIRGEQPAVLEPGGRGTLVCGWPGGQWPGRNAQMLGLPTSSWDVADEEGRVVWADSGSRTERLPTQFYTIRVDFHIPEDPGTERLLEVDVSGLEESVLVVKAMIESEICQAAREELRDAVQRFNDAPFYKHLFIRKHRWKRDYEEAQVLFGRGNCEEAQVRAKDVG